MVSEQVSHTSSLSASGFLALWLHRPSSSPVPPGFWSFSTVGHGLLPLFSPRSFILSRAICFLSVLYGLAEVCESLCVSLFATRSDRKFIRFLLGSPCWGSLVLAHLGCSALSHQPFFTCSFITGKASVKVCRSPLLCWLFCVFGCVADYHYKKNYCVLF